MVIIWKWIGNGSTLRLQWVEGVGRFCHLRSKRLRRGIQLSSLIIVVKAVLVVFVLLLSLHCGVYCAFFEFTLFFSRFFTNVHSRKIGNAHIFFVYININ